MKYGEAKDKSEKLTEASSMQPAPGAERNKAAAAQGSQESHNEEEEEKEENQMDVRETTVENKESVENDNSTEDEAELSEAEAKQEGLGSGGKEQIDEV